MPAATCLSAKGREGARRTANCEERVRHQGLGTGGQGRGNGNGNIFVREGTRRAHKRRTARAPTRGAPTGACGGRRPQGGTCDGWKSQRVRGQAQGLPLPARAAGGGRKGGHLRWMEVAARTRAGTRPAPTGACGGRRPQRGALAMDGSRSAYEGRHKACPYRRVRREAAAKGGTCDGWKSQRVRGQAQGLPLPARAAGGGRKGGHLRWMEVAARTRAGTRPAPTGACGGRRPQRGALAMDGSRSAYEGRHKACPYRRVRREAAAKGGTCDGWKSQRVRGVDGAGGTRSGEALSVGHLPPMQTPGRRGML